jgi:uncharacterized protein YjiS (DUF1127 family)
MMLVNYLKFQSKLCPLLMTAIRHSWSQAMHRRDILASHANLTDKSFDATRPRRNINPPERNEEKRVMHAIARHHALAGAPSKLSLVSRLTGEFRTWRRRARERTELARMSDSELHDIGVTSADRWAEINKPFWRK